MLRPAVPVLHITNANAAEDFYCRGLGFQISWEATASDESRDPTYLQVQRDEAILHLSSNAGDAVVGGVAYIPVPDVDALYVEFSSRGVEIHLPPIDQTWGMREMYVRDPDGNTLRFGAPTAS
jgi:uncharacterized glyoxalase superfamily protein PhnB